MIPYSQELNYSVNGDSSSSETTQTVNLSTMRGFKYLKVDYEFSCSAGSDVTPPTTTVGFAGAISRFTIQQNGNNRIDLQSAQLSDAISAMNRGGQYGSDLEDLVYDDVVGAIVSGTTYRGYFYVPLSTNVGPGMTMTVGFTPASMGGTWNAVTVGATSCRINLSAVGSSDVGNISVVVVPTSAELNSRIQMPQGSIRRVVLSDGQTGEGSTSAAYNVTQLQLPAQTFTNPAILVGAWHLINGDGLTDENKKYAYVYPFNSTAGDVLQIQRTAASICNCFFVLGGQ